MRHRIETLWRDRRVCRAADRVMVLGPGHEEALIRGHGLDREQIVWTPAEVDVGRFVPGPAVSKDRPILTFSVRCRNKADVPFEAAQILQQRGSTSNYELLGVFCSGREAGSLSSLTIRP